MSTVGTARAPRVDDDESAAIVLSLPQKGQKVRSRTDRIVAPEDDQLAVCDVFVRGAPAFAERRFNRRLRRGAADTALKLAGTESVPEAPTGDGHLHQAERAAVAVRQNRLGAGLGDDRAPARGNLSQRLVPADALPL